MKRRLIRPLLTTARQCTTTAHPLCVPRHSRLVVRNFSTVPRPDMDPFTQQFSTKADQKLMHGQTFPGIKEMLAMISQQSWRQFFIRSGVFVGVVTAVVYGVFKLWGEYFRKEAVKQTTVVAHETLSSDEVSKKVVSLSNQVAQSLLENPAVLAQVTEFSKKLILMEQTKSSATDLAIYAINAENTRQAAAQLAKQVAGNIMADQATQLQLADLLRRAVAMEENKQALYIQLKYLVEDPKTHKLLIDLAKYIVFQTLHDQEVKKQAIEFVTEVLKDQKLHNKGGEAIWQAVKSAFTPSFFQGKPPASSSLNEEILVLKEIPQEELKKNPELNINELNDVVARSAIAAAETLAEEKQKQEQKIEEEYSEKKFLPQVDEESSQNFSQQKEEEELSSKVEETQLSASSSASAALSFDTTDSSSSSSEHEQTLSSKKDFSESKKSEDLLENPKISEDLETSKISQLETIQTEVETKKTEDLFNAKISEDIVDSKISQDFLETTKSQEKEKMSAKFEGLDISESQNKEQSKIFLTTEKSEKIDGESSTYLR